MRNLVDLPDLCSIASGMALNPVFSIAAALARVAFLCPIVRRNCSAASGFNKSRASTMAASASPALAAA